MYSFKSRIRYSEVNAHKKLDIAGIINYFQDCSTFHSEELGIGLEYLMNQNKAWMITNWHVKIVRLPELGEEVSINTWPSGFKAMFGYRSFTMTDAKGELIAAANSIWVLMDLKKQRPIRTNTIEVEKYKLEEAFSMPSTPRKLEISPEYVEGETFQVIRDNLDTNHHVNNGQYIKMAMEYLPTDFKTEEVLVEYKKSALLGDTISPRITLSNEKCTVVLAGSDGSPYCILEFRRNCSN